jgi:hemolysin activation/secretion protein
MANQVSKETQVLGVFMLAGMMLTQAAFAIDAQNAGELLQQLQPPVLKVPDKEAREALMITTPEPTRTALVPSDGFRVQINSVKITGTSVYPEAQLLALLQDLIGKETNLAGLEEMADRITRYYRKDGYILVRAYLPAQDIKNGQVEIAVLEGRYDAIKVTGATALQPANLPLNGIKSGALVTEAALERTLLLLSDRPGVQVSSTLQPGATVGTSDLIIDMVPGPLLSGGVELDNFGSSSTGKYRLGAEVRLNNPSGWGDLVTVNGRYSGNGLQYGRLAYQVPVGGYGSKIGAAMSSVHYQLGEDFSSLNAVGRARTATLFGTHPLIRSRQANLNLQLSVDSKRFHDSMDSAANPSDKASNILALSLSGDEHDLFGSGGVSAFSLAYTRGQLRINSADAQAIDDRTAQASGSFGKINLSGLHLQNLTAKSSLYSAYTGQWAFKNLDSSEKMSLGGSGGVRAYAPGATSADSAHLLTLELRHKLNVKWQLASFIDISRATINKSPWASATAANSATLAGSGIQVSWSEADDFGVRAFYARKLGSEPNNGDGSERSRFGMQLAKSY